MAFNLPALVRAKGIRRASLTFRPITPTKAQATDLAAIYAPAWRVWSDGLDRIMAGYDPEPLTDSLTTDSPSQIESAVGALASEFLSRLVTEIGPGLRRWSVRYESYHRTRWSANIKAATGLDLDMILTATEAQDTLEAWQARNIALVTNISDQARGRISDAVYRGYAERRPAREVAKEISEATGLGRKRALGVASDQLSKLSGALDDERMAEAGLELWKYRHGGKLHPRAWHKARDGRIYTLKGSKQVNPDGSPMAGGDVIEANDEPSRPPWCSCRKQAYISLMSELD